LKFSKIKPLRGTTSEWTTNDIVIGKNEMAFENMEDGTKKMKIGDGIHKWSELPYVIDFQAIKAQVDLANTIKEEALLRSNNVETVKNDSNVIKNDITIIKNENTQIKTDVIEIKQEFLNILPEFKVSFADTQPTDAQLWFRKI